MTIYKRRKVKLIDELKDKEYREAFVAEQINVGIPFQIKAIRNQRKWSQKKLGEQVHEVMKQEQISRLEDPNYASVTISTLKKLASAFDVGLMVRFVPISYLIEWELRLTSESLKVVSFDEDIFFNEIPVNELPINELPKKNGNFPQVPLHFNNPVSINLNSRYNLLEQIIKQRKGDKVNEEQKSTSKILTYQTVDTDHYKQCTFKIYDPQYSTSPGG